MNRYLPLHWNIRNQLRNYVGALVVHTLWSLGFFTRMAQWHENRLQNPHLSYPTFGELVGNGMACLYLVIMGCIIWGIVAYSTCFDGSKNIYRLRRMPWGAGVFARCAVMPFCGILVATVWSAILLALQYWSYCANAI